MSEDEGSGLPGSHSSHSANYRRKLGTQEKETFYTNLNINIKIKIKIKIDININISSRLESRAQVDINKHHLSVRHKNPPIQHPLLRVQIRPKCGCCTSLNFC